MLQTPSFTIHLWPPRLSDSYLREPEPRTLNRIALGIALSFCAHLLLLFLIPKHDLTQTLQTGGSKGPLVVRLNRPASSPPPAAATVAQASPAPSTRAPQPPRMMTAPVTTPQSTPLVPETPPPVRPADPAPTDFMSMINARRAHRGAIESEAGGRGKEPSADDVAMSNINRNLASLTRGEGTSGVFQIMSKGHRAAQFSFRGWTNDARNSRRDVIDVDAGLNGNIEQAIIRRMIELIRTHYKGNFNWESHRLGRVVVLSARIEDNAGLEEFMMREFFP